MVVELHPSGRHSSCNPRRREKYKNFFFFFPYEMLERSGHRLMVGALTGLGCRRFSRQTDLNRAEFVRSYAEGFGVGDSVSSGQNIRKERNNV
jgi:hypothetical protein